MKKLIPVLFLTTLLALQGFAQGSQVFVKNGKAIDGYDAVAFFKESKAVKGEAALSYTWNNATWLFSNQNNLEAFKQQPEKYAPQYGGWCAYGCSRGYKAPTQADTWTIVDEKLYFNYNLKVKDSWMKEKEALIMKANENWTKIKDSN